MKTLIAYFSHRGMNYAPGGMVELKVGNTERAAKAAAELTGAPLFEIRAERDYPFDYHECVEVSRRELKENARPALAELPEGLGELETLVLCYPCWCGTMPMPVWSFLEALGPGAPRILPLCTNEGSGMGRSEADIRRLCPGAELAKGLSVRGSAAGEAGPEIRAWLEKNGLL